MCRLSTVKKNGSVSMIGGRLAANFWQIVGRIVDVGFLVGDFGRTGYFVGLSVGGGFFEVEDYFPSFNILVGHEELLQRPELIACFNIIQCADGIASDVILKSSRFKRGQVKVNYSIHWTCICKVARINSKPVI